MEATEKTKNQFKLIKELEDLGPAILHLGKFRKREEKVHVKISKKKYLSKDECKYNKEIVALQDLNHRNVIKFLGVWVDEDKELRIVTEFLETNIGRVMKKRNRPFTELETKNIMAQVLDGLNHIHQRNYMHRSLKPEVLKCDPEANVVKISEFTHALPLDVKQMIKLEVKPIWYLAPEIMLNLPYSTPVDIWAAGCIMAELLAGKPLFDGKNENDQLKKICEIKGTFTKAEWPSGYGEAKTGGYGLPLVVEGSGLTKLNLPEKSEAKQAILQMLPWVPEKRPTAEECLKLKYFIDDAGKEDIIQDTQLKLQSWTRKWEPNLDKSSIWELQNIMEGLSPRKEKQIADMFENQDHDPRKPMTYQDQSSGQFDVPLLSRGTPRASVQSVALNENIRQLQSQMNESPRNSPQKEFGNTGMQHQNGNADLFQHKSSSSSLGGPSWMRNQTNRGNTPEIADDPFRPAGPRRRNVNNPLQRSVGGISNKDGLFAPDNPIAHSLDQDQRGRGFDDLFMGQPIGRRILNEDERRDRMLKNNPMRYRDVYGDDYMRTLLGNKPAPGQQSMQTDDDYQKHATNASPNEPKRKRADDFHGNRYEPSWF